MTSSRHHWTGGHAPAVTMIAALLMPCLFQTAAAGLESLLDDQGKIWSKTPNDFAKAQPSSGFRWLSKEKTGARTVKPLSFAGAKIIETVVRFTDSALDGMLLYVYTRGDAGEKGESEFSELVADTEKQITAWAGVKPSPVVEEKRGTSVKLLSKTWKVKAHEVEMQWSYAESRSFRGTRYPYRAEYIRLQVGPLVAVKRRVPQIRDNTMKSKLAKSSIKDLPKRVKKSTNGDAIIQGVPMVDQGMKGYCVAATIERILRYYGEDVDQHEIAQVAKSSAAGGTSPTMMAEGLKRAGKHLGIKLKIYHTFDVNDFQRMITKYNRAVRRRKDLRDIQTGNVIVVAAVYQQMDTDILKEIRSKPVGYMNGFMNDIINDINLGMPLAWSVILGKINEDPPLPQANGGHMRMIIGYNKKTQDIFYTDSWGSRHELKKMPLRDAWAITTALYSMRPRP